MKHRSSRAIFVLESPWELDDGDANRTSVLPFVEGVAKLSGDTEVLYANFYDESSFDKALSILAKCFYKNSIVYLAAHGLKNKIGNVDLTKALLKVGAVSEGCNITGVMLGSCFVGGNRGTLEVCIQGSNLHWCAGYASESSWLEGTMIDCSIISRMLLLDGRSFQSRDSLINNLAQAVAPFSDRFIIGNDKRETPTALADSLNFVIQPTGQGKSAKLVTAEVFDASKAFLQ